MADGGQAIEFEEAHDRLVAYMKGEGLKLTRQRQVILEAFLEADRHIAVDELVQEVRRRDSGIGHATVYRAIKLFVDAGLAHERNFSDGAAQYEPAEADDEAHHDHLICTRCGAILEFEHEEIERLQEEVAARFGFQLTDHRMELYGECARWIDNGRCRREAPSP